MTARWLLAVLVLVLPAFSALQAEPCEQLVSIASPVRSITLAKLVGAGGMAAVEGAKKLHDVPSFCRVAAILRPTADSEIHVEVWLPESRWNGKFLAVGSGGWGGSIAYSAMADALRRGYATAATDDGHTGPSADFVVGHREKLIDFAYRAEHEMTVTAKALIRMPTTREAVGAISTSSERASGSS